MHNFPQHPRLILYLRAESPGIPTFHIFRLSWHYKNIKNGRKTKQGLSFFSSISSFHHSGFPQVLRREFSIFPFRHARMKVMRKLYTWIRTAPVPGLLNDLDRYIALLTQVRIIIDHTDDDVRRFTAYTEPTDYSYTFSIVYCPSGFEFIQQNSHSESVMNPSFPSQEIALI